MNTTAKAEGCGIARALVTTGLAACDDDDDLFSAATADLEVALAVIVELAAMAVSAYRTRARLMLTAVEASPLIAVTPAPPEEAVQRYAQYLARTELTAIAAIEATTE